MAHRHRLRRGGRPQPTETDIRLWRRLMVRAEVMSRDPGRDGKPFSIAADKARKVAVLPIGCQSDDGNPFSALIRLGQRWLTMTGVERIAAARTLPDLIERCGDLLEPTGGPQRVRKDLFE